MRGPRHVRRGWTTPVNASYADAPPTPSEGPRMGSPAAGVAVIALMIAVTPAAHAAPGHAAAASTSARTADAPPVAPRVPVIDDYFGTKVTDDYRWMEDRPAPPFEKGGRK